MITQEQQGYIEKGFKIPIDTDCTGSNWIISLARESTMPSDEELKQMRSYQEFEVRHTYSESYSEVVLKLGLPRDIGHNTVIFKKSERGWLCSRKYTEDKHAQTLVEIMDRNEDIIPSKWEEWKREHPEIFPPTPDTTPPAQ